jgi:hypothetical protein
MKHFFFLIAFVATALPAFAQNGTTEFAANHAYSKSFDPPKVSALGEAAPAIGGSEVTALYSQKILANTLCTGSATCVFSQPYCGKKGESLALYFDNASPALLASLTIKVCNGKKMIAGFAITDFETSDSKTFILRKAVSDKLPTDTIIDSLILSAEPNKIDKTLENNLVYLNITAINMTSYNLNH